MADNYYLLVYENPDDLADAVGFECDAEGNLIWTDPENSPDDPVFGMAYRINKCAEVAALGWTRSIEHLNHWIYELESEESHG